MVEAVYVEEGAPDMTLGALPVRMVADGVIARVGSTVTPQPVLAVVRRPPERPRVLEQATLVVGCVDVADPGNAGTILRSAAAAGAGAVVMTSECADVWSPKVVRASAGAVLRVPVATVDTAAAMIERLEAAGLRPVAAVPRGGRPPEAVELAGRVAIVVGNEAHGLGDEIEARIAEHVTIPMASGAESLNVAMTVAVLCFEAARQRRA